MDTGDFETMHTTCPACDTSYAVPDERIGAKGRKVRCTRCGEEWRVFAASVVEAASALAEVSRDPAPDSDPFATDEARFEADRRDDDTEPSFEAATSRPAAPPIAATPAPDPAPAATETAAAELAEPHEPHEPLHPLPGRVHIRTRRRLPALGRHALSVAAARVAPFVGPAVFLAAAIVVAGVYLWRDRLVAWEPRLAGLYAAFGAPVNLRGLSFGRVETLREIDNGQPVLVVEGSITNVTGQMRDVPALRFALRGVDTQELYAWSIDPRSTTIEAGDTIRFRTRLAAPPDLATDVQVRFVERHSRQAGLP